MKSHIQATHEQRHRGGGVGVSSLTFEKCRARDNCPHPQLGGGWAKEKCAQKIVSSVESMDALKRRMISPNVI